MILAVYGMMMFFVISGGVEGFAIVWLLVVPPVAMFCFSLLYGGFFSTLLGISLVIYMSMPPVKWGYDYPEIYRQRFPIVYFFSVVICIFVQYNLVSANVKRNMLIEELKETNSKLEDASRSKSDFLANMTHEIRTPINAVPGMNEMVLRESSEENILGYARDIQSSGKTLLSIVNSILDFSKIEDGKMEILPVKYDTVSVIHNLVNSIYERAKVKSLEFIVDIDETLPSVLLGDDVRIEQIIMNLLTNAVKYTEKGSITFSIKDGGRDTDSIYLLVSVKDTGIGIKEEDMGKLFESFERIEEKRNRNIEGTGLGMLIVTKLLAMMESELQVQSVYGQGTEFSFLLKQSIIDEEPIGNYIERLERSIYQSERENYLYAPDAKILVVDDNEMNLMVATNLMKWNGIIPDLASSGEEAIEMIQNKKYDIIFMDHMMPKMDGIETLARLREGQMLEEGVTVIALTANAVVGAKETYLEAGFDDYLSKPIDVDRLEEKLEKYLSEEIVSYRTKDEQVKSNLETDVVNVSNEEPDDFKKKLKFAGFDVDNGLRYCADDEEFYTIMLQEYVSAHVEKTKRLEEFFEIKNWHEYKILIHSLKSTSKTIGAEHVSEEARLLEEAAKEENATYIMEHHADFCKKYKDAVKIIVDVI